LHSSGPRTWPHQYISIPLSRPGERERVRHQRRSRAHALLRRNSMTESVLRFPAILVLTGASGAGKTTLILKLNELAIPGVEGINCDRVKIDADETAGSTDRQADILRYWISELSQRRTSIELAVLDTQIRPHRALEVLNQAGMVYTQIVLVDCDRLKRNQRLHMDRSQPELANPQMDCWAAYLRGQADALDLSIIDTSTQPIDRSLSELELLVRDLLNRARAA